MGEFEEDNNSDKQLEDLILKNDLILFNYTNFHSESGTFTLKVIHYFFLISPGRIVLTYVIVITFQLFWRMMDHLLLKGFRDGS